MIQNIQEQNMRSDYFLVEEQQINYEQQKYQPPQYDVNDEFEKIYQNDTEEDEEDEFNTIFNGSKNNKEQR